MTLKKRLGKHLNGLVASLEKTLNESVKDLRVNIRQARRSLKALESTNVNDADYVIFLNSCWASEGEASTTTQYHGSLADAIKKAEDEFMAENRRNDVQAHYFVNIKLADITYSVPKEFWENYKRKFN